MKPNFFTEITKSSLGKKTHVPIKYSPKILMAIPRPTNQRNKQKIHGLDIWNIYEVYWININKKPSMNICKITYNSNSSFIIEAKSLKLYINSLFNKPFKSIDELKSTIEKDIKNILKTPLTIHLYSCEKQNKTNQAIGQCLEKEIKTTTPFKAFLFNNVTCKETLYTNCFRSLCPITKQPDFATIAITYTGKKIDKQSLFDYLIQYRSYEHFHEQCIEKIYLDLINQKHIKNIIVQGLFTRRGGIDLNPIRSSTKTFKPFQRRPRQ